MEKTRKKHIKRYITWVLIAAMVVLLATMPLMAADNAEDDDPTATIKSGTVETGSITNVLNGGGTLSEDTAVNVTIPSGVKLTEFLVDNGDTVSQGDALAAVDKVSVMTAIAELQETLDYLDEEIGDADSESDSTRITAPTAGKVKLVYAQEGDNVQDVILDHGALAVISLDGRMALDVVTETDLTVGDSVLVTLEEDEEVTGRVESTLGDALIISIPDNGYAVDTPARISDLNGDYLGYGKLYIHNPWNATAYYGTVSSVWVEENDTLYPGQTLLTLEDSGHSSQYEILVSQRQQYEEVMLELFRMYESGTVAAPCDGIVSGVDEDSAYLLSGSDIGWTIQLLANAPGAEPDAGYTNYAAVVEGNDNGNLILRKNPTPVQVEDYKSFSISTDVSAMTETAYLDAGCVYTLDANGEWVQTNVTRGAVLLITDTFGIYVTSVDLDGGSEPSAPTQPPEDGSEATDPTQPAEGGGSEDGEATDPSVPEGESSGNAQRPGGDMSGMISGMVGNYTGGIITEPSFTLFDLTENTILTVTPGAEMTLDITVDELDIGKLHIGQEAAITVSALADQGITGTVAEIGSAENSGGNSKFTVTITMGRDDNMLAGMSACAAMDMGTVENALIVPAAALVDDGTQTFVYTSYDEKADSLGDPVAVIVGVSDGQNVQILSGLDAGDDYYYSYYDAQELD